MGKADRNRRESAREKIAAQQAAERRAQKRRQMLMAGGSVVAVLAIVVVLIVVKSLNKTSAGSNIGTASASTVSKLTSVPAATLASVNKGSANPKTLIPITGTALTANGKPEVLYMGAEYCPFCATERWAMTVALSRFGTFSGLSFIHSSGTDTPASIPTLTFYKSTYTSKYLTFTPVEMQKVDKSTLQTPTKAQSAILTKYDAAPQLPAQDAGSIPFIDFGNKYMVSGASYDYSVLQGKSFSQIATAIQDPSTDIAKGADGTANYLTAGICKLTSNQPATACTPTVQAIEAGL
jgi:thiol-disulfide isomerase/thioredoxin